MNCCDANGNCNQGRDCPARGPNMAFVARIKRSTPAPLPETKPEPEPLRISAVVKWTVIGLLLVPCVAGPAVLLIMIGQRLGEWL